VNLVIKSQVRKQDMSFRRKDERWMKLVKALIFRMFEPFDCSERELARSLEFN
jgi:hypothetical protein